MQFDVVEPDKLGKTVCGYGVPGTGKTLDIARSVPNAVWIQSKRNNLGSYDQWLTTDKGKEAAKRYGLRSWDRITIPEPPKRPEGWEPLSDLKAQLKAVAGAIGSGEIAASCIVIDEYTEFVRRQYGDGGSYLLMPQVEADNRWFTSFAERTGIHLILLGHEVKPVHEMILEKQGKDDKGPVNKRRGEITDLGGPAIPFKKERVSFVSLLDFCLRRVCSHSGDATTYFWLTKPSNDFLIKPRAEGWARKEARPFGDLWRAAGWSFPTYKGTDDNGRLIQVAPDPFLT